MREGGDVSFDYSPLDACCLDARDSIYGTNHRVCCDHLKHADKPNLINTTNHDFQFADADITIVSSDGLYFRVHRASLLMLG